MLVILAFVNGHERRPGGVEEPVCGLITWGTGVSGKMKVESGKCVGVRGLDLHLKLAQRFFLRALLLQLLQSSLFLP